MPYFSQFSIQSHMWPTIPNGFIRDTFVDCVSSFKTAERSFSALLVAIF